jgi:two-component system, sensor histidine kinase and response regulator
MNIDQDKKELARILIVDDNLKNIQTLGSILKANNYKVDFSTSGKDGLDLLNEYNIDLLLLDVMMPEMDGFEVCRIIRSNKAFDNLPIIFLTALTDKESLIKGFSLGAQDYLTKPFNSVELLVRVNSYIELKFNREKIIKSNNELEQTILEKTKQLTQANTELKELDKAKSQFISILNHEIRTPLNNIKGSVQLLKSVVDNKELEKLIDLLTSSVNDLEKFSLSTILITKIRSKNYKLHIAPININELIDLQLEKFDEQINTNKIELDKSGMKEQVVLESDSDLLDEALVRLLNNAIKFTPENGRISIILIQEESKKSICIKDTGTGFSDEYLDSNYFINQTENILKGTGQNLNFYLVHSIIKYFGGNFEYGNNPEGGAFVKILFD